MTDLSYNRHRAFRLICEASRAVGLLKGIRDEFPQLAFIDRDIAEISAEIERAIDAYPESIQQEQTGET